MNYKIFSFIVTIIFLFFARDIHSQYTMGIGGSAYYFVNSRDDNIHYGPHLRFAYDWDNYMIEASGTYFLKAISSIATKAYEVNPETNIPQSINIRNSVTAITYMTDLNFIYYFRGVPIGGRGFYGIAGAGAFIYDQTYDLSHFDNLVYYSEQYIDKANYISTQIIINLGVGGKVPLRNSSWYYEAKFSFLTDPYLDYERAVQGSHFITVATGIRFHMKTRKNRFERMATGRTKKQKVKSKKRIRK